MPQPTPKRKAKKSRSANVLRGPQSVSQPTKFLPEIDGPKLGPFKSPYFHYSDDFQFEELLHEPSSSGGGEGNVFKATLNGEAYAVKLFKFFDKDEGRFRFWDSQNEQITDVDLVGNLDPFNAECRAYGRIEEIYTKYRTKNIDIGIIAIPCYGYIEISSSHERDIVARFGPLDFQRSETNTITPLRAIVKQYSSHIPIDPKKRSIKLMLRDLKTMHNNGLYPIDIRAENYREGRLVDFGMALTEPSCVLRVLDGYMADRERGRGLGAFDKMIKAAGIKTQVRATYGTGRPGWGYRTRAGRKANGDVDFIQLVNRRGHLTDKQTW
ncbi:hypothetical protein PSPO01_02235 [Paraphaeosphaeria sporulosa]